ncbi:MAG: hypothetical protein STSR0002_15770 [Smithella sp.]|jgi:uncharacterized membrane-anchored protein YjiN (DUF445 family)
MIILFKKFPFLKKLSDEEELSIFFDKITNEEILLSKLSSVELAQRIHDAIIKNDEAQRILLEHFLSLRLVRIQNKAIYKSAIITSVFALIIAIISLVLTCYIPEQRDKYVLGNIATNVYNGNCEKNIDNFTYRTMPSTITNSPQHPKLFFPPTKEVHNTKNKNDGNDKN